MCIRDRSSLIEGALSARLQISRYASTGSGSPGFSTAACSRAVSYTHLKAGVTEVRIKSDAATISLDLPALKAAQAVAGGAITVSAKPLAANTLSAAAQNAIGNRPVFSFTLTSGGKPVSNFGGGSASISIPYTPQKGEDTGKLCVVYVDAVSYTHLLSQWRLIGRKKTK